MSRVKLYNGIMQDVLSMLPTESFAAGMADFSLGNPELSAEAWTAVLRVLKPGAFFVGFGGRPHRIVCSLEDAGWEIRDSFAWLNYQGGRPWTEFGVLAMKPTSLKFAELALQHGVGGLNINRCRIPYLSDADRESATPQGACTSASGCLGGKVQRAGLDRSEFVRPELLGRYPGNLLYDGSAEALAEFAKYGERQSTKTPMKSVRSTNSGKYASNGKDKRLDAGATVEYEYPGDFGTVSRFFPAAPDPWDYFCKLLKPPGQALLLDVTGSPRIVHAAVDAGFASIISVGSMQPDATGLFPKLGTPTQGSWNGVPCSVWGNFSKG